MLNVTELEKTRSEGDGENGGSRFNGARVGIYARFAQLSSRVFSIIIGVYIQIRVGMLRNQEGSSKVSSDFSYCHRHI